MLAVAQTASKQSGPPPYPARQPASAAPLDLETSATFLLRKTCPWGGACPRCLPLQAKLAVGAANDPLESEADATAARVMRGETPLIHAVPAALSRKCSCGASCDKCQSEEESELHRKADGAGARGEAAPPIVHDVLRSPNEPLDAGARSFMESRFGRDFSDVRIRTDGRAPESARSVSALAYTVGSHLVFGPGQYAPHSTQGRSLLVHELTHVVQQSGSEPKIQREPTTGVHASNVPANVPYEKYAEAVGKVYRRNGLIEAAHAVAKCRQGHCSHILTEAEAYGAYRRGRVDAGLDDPPAEESKSHKGLTGAVLGPAVGYVSAVKLATRVATPIAVPHVTWRPFPCDIDR